MLLQKFLVIGSDGQLGSSLDSFLRKSGNSVLSTVFTKNQISQDKITLDLSSDNFDLLLNKPIDIAFFCAAITSIDQCRNQPRESRKINIDNTYLLARQLNQNGTALFFPSTNLVFDGQLSFPKVTDKVNPQCEYGRQKAEIENLLTELTNKIAIIRFSKIIGSGMTIIKSWIKDLQLGKSIHPFSDMVLSPVSLNFATKTIVAIMENKSYGIWQISANQDVTYEQMAKELANRMGVSQNLVRPITVNQSGLKFETIPKNTTLDTTRLKDEIGINPPDVWDVLDELLIDYHLNSFI